MQDESPSLSSLAFFPGLAAFALGPIDDLDQRVHGCRQPLQSSGDFIQPIAVELLEGSILPDLAGFHESLPELSISLAQLPEARVEIANSHALVSGGVVGLVGGIADEVERSAKVPV